MAQKAVGAAAGGEGVGQGVRGRVVAGTAERRYMDRAGGEDYLAEEVVLAEEGEGGAEGVDVVVLVEGDEVLTDSCCDFEIVSVCATVCEDDKVRQEIEATYCNLQWFM